MEKKSDVKIEVKMISAVTEALKFRKQNPKADNEKIMKHAAKFITQEKDKQAKLAMIVAVNEALKLTDKQNMLDRDIIKQVMKNLSETLSKVDN